MLIIEPYQARAMSKNDSKPAVARSRLSSVAAVKNARHKMRPAIWRLRLGLTCEFSNELEVMFASQMLSIFLKKPLELL